MRTRRQIPADESHRRSEAMRKAWRRRHIQREGLGNYLARLSKEELCDWTIRTLCELTSQHVEALDLQGWQVVMRDGHRWRFNPSDDGGLSEDELLDWAGERLCELTDAHTKALDLMGYQILNKLDANCRWPFETAQCECPDWCEHLACEQNDEGSPVFSLSAGTVLNWLTSCAKAKEQAA
jgi:hypothetical protein